MLTITNMLTVVLICMCVYVVCKWSGPILQIIRKMRLGDPLNYYECLVFGVFVSFLSKSTDSTFWLFPWTAKDLGLMYVHNYLVSIGINFNLVFRIFLGMIAAYFHIKSIYLYSHQNNPRPRKVVGVCCLVALAYASFVLVFKAIV